MRPKVVVEFKNVTKDEVYVVDKAENKVVNIIAQKHDFKRDEVVIVLEPTDSGNYAELKTGRIYIDSSSSTFRKAVREGVLEGLLAHETMHLVLAESGDDQQVNAAVSKAVGKREERVLGICEEYKEYCKDAIQVMVTLGLVLKDVLNDDAVIKAGLGRELYEYYTSTITTKLEAEKKGLGDISAEDVENLFIAMIGTMPAWVAFYRNNMPEEGARVRSEMFKRLSDIPTPLRLAVNRLSDKIILVDPRDEKGVDELVELMLDAFEEVLRKKSAQERQGAEQPAEP